MNPKDKDKVISFYNDQLQKHGHSSKTLGWDKQRQFLRYHILLSQWNLNGKSILDFGCGFGDMFSYIEKQQINIEYEGVDINENLIKAGKKAYPKTKLICRDPLKEGLDKIYDYIFSSGVHNFKFENNWSYIEKTFALFNQHSRKGFALNFISDKVDFRKDDIYYSNPSQILELAYQYSNRIVLRNDYMPFEFSLFLNKDKGFEKDLAVYSDFKNLFE